MGEYYTSITMLVDQLNTTINNLIKKICVKKIILKGDKDWFTAAIATHRKKVEKLIKNS